jgi:hypothetical protein
MERDCIRIREELRHRIPGPPYPPSPCRITHLPSPSQLMDDILDYESASATLGKPGGADLQLGLATGPALYAWDEHPEMGELIRRKFEKPGDVELVRFTPLSDVLNF